MSSAAFFRLWFFLHFFAAHTTTPTAAAVVQRWTFKMADFVVFIPSSVVLNISFRNYLFSFPFSASINVCSVLPYLYVQYFRLNIKGFFPSKNDGNFFFNGKKCNIYSLHLADHDRSMWTHLKLLKKLFVCSHSVSLLLLLSPPAVRCTSLLTWTWVGVVAYTAQQKQQTKQRVP